MFDPTAMVANCRWGYICRHEGRDYHTRPPLSVRLNPLRLEIGIGRTRPCWIVINKDGVANRKLSNLTWKLWRRRIWERRNEADEIERLLKLARDK